MSIPRYIIPKTFNYKTTIQKTCNDRINLQMENNNPQTPAMEQHKRHNHSENIWITKYLWLITLNSFQFYCIEVGILLTKIVASSGRFNICTLLCCYISPLKHEFPTRKSYKICLTQILPLNRGGRHVKCDCNLKCMTYLYYNYIQE